MKTSTNTKRDFIANYKNYFGMTIDAIAKIYGVKPDRIRLYTKYIPQGDRSKFIRPYKKKKEKADEIIRVEKSAVERIKELEALLRAEKSTSKKLRKALTAAQGEVRRSEKALEVKSNLILSQAAKLRDLQADLKVLKEEKDEASAAISKLEDELRVIRDSEERISCSIEQHYRGELKDALRAAAERYVQAAVTKSVYREILEGFLEENPESSQKRRVTKSLERIKRASSASEVLKSLREAGFKNIKRMKNGHYRCNFFGDKRYCITIPSTPSDVRTWKNQVRDIIRVIF